MDKLLLVTEVASMLRLSEEHVRCIIRRGVLRAYKEGNRGGYRVAQCAVDDYINNKLKEV